MFLKALFNSLEFKKALISITAYAHSIGITRISPPLNKISVFALSEIITSSYLEKFPLESTRSPVAIFNDSGKYFLRNFLKISSYDFIFSLGCFSIVFRVF